MKKLTLVFILGALLGLSAKAQVVFKDQNLVDILKGYGMSGCFTGLVMDTTNCPGRLNLTTINYQGPPPTDTLDLTGLEYCRNLRSIFLISPGLAIKCYNLPERLDTMVIYHSPLIFPTPFPSSLRFLDLQGSKFLNDLPALPDGLTVFRGDNNDLKSLPNIPSKLQELSVPNNLLTTLPPTSQGLQFINCQFNQLDSFNFLAPSIVYIYAAANRLKSLPVLPDSLQFLDVTRSLLTSLPSLPLKLNVMNVGGNQLTALPSLPASLTFLTCSDNLLTTLPSLPPLLNTIIADSNQIIFLPVLPDSIRYLSCVNNELVSLPSLPDSMGTLNISKNLNLHCLPPVKKIHDFTMDNTGIRCLPNAIWHFGYDPSIDTLPICDLLNTNNCDIAWNIQGRIYNDQNGDCMQQGTEQAVFPVKVNLFDSGNNLLQSAYFAGGSYSFKTGTGTYKVAIDSTDLPFTYSCPVTGDTTITLTYTDSLEVGVNFGIKANLGYDIAAVYLYSRFRPGFISQLSVGAGDVARKINLPNTNIISGTVSLIINGPAKYVGPAPGALTPTSVTSNTILWNVDDFEKVIYNNSFNVMLKTDTAAHIGDKICLQLIAHPSAPDKNISNDTLDECFTVRGSLDPNEKTVSPSGNIDSTDRYLTYTIHFQNTGTDTAENISITDTLSPYLDVTTFRLIASSHKNVTQIWENGAVKFSFPGIHLPDSVTNQLASQGYVKYLIRVKDHLPLGTKIMNTAYIYFDLNAPVITDTTLNTMVERVFTSGGMGGNESADVYLYPNPTTGILNIISANFTPQWLILYDISGRKIAEQRFTPQIDIHSFTNGIYFMEVKNEANTYRTKFVKQ